MISCLRPALWMPAFGPKTGFDKLYRILRREEGEGSPETASSQSLLFNVMEKLRELGSVSWQKAEEDVLELKSLVSKLLDNTKEHVIPSVKKAAAHVQEVGLPQVKKGVGFVVDTTREVVFPLVITGCNYVWATAIAHPWLSGSLLLLLLCYRFSGGGSPGKMMKAPGRGGKMMRRSVFANNPSGYFRDLRGKGR